MRKFGLIFIVLLITGLLAGSAFSQTPAGEPAKGAAPCPCENCPEAGGMDMHHGMKEHGMMPCGCGMQGMGMMGQGMMGQCGMMGAGMGKGRMMSPGLMGIIGVHPGMGEMRALMNPRVKEHLANPEIKAFLDETKDQRRNLLLRKFDYFEAARNPQTKPEDLKKLRQEIKKLQADIYVKSPDLMETSDKDMDDME